MAYGKGRLWVARGSEYYGGDLVYGDPIYGRNSVIRDQAEAFKNDIRGVLVHYMHQAVRSNHTTLANRFRAAGHPELVKLLES